MAGKTIYRYKGDGTDYYNGVPARDLDETDVSLLTDEQRAVLDEGPLYQRTRAQESETPPPVPTVVDPPTEPEPDAEPDEPDVPNTIAPAADVPSPSGSRGRRG
jgi:hypothetical protein